MGDAPGLVTAICGGVGVVLGAWALVVKARTSDSRPLRLLQRLWDWLEGKGYDAQVPAGLRTAVVAVLSNDRDQAGEDR